MKTAKRTLTISSITALVCASALVFGTTTFAQDLGDNETCLECHADTEWTAPENSDQPRVHQDSGAFNVEDHAEWSCIDCHDYVTEVDPHPEDISDSAVDCENCHDETPSK